MNHSHPILSCHEALDFENELLGKSDVKTWTAMRSAGKLVGLNIISDFHEIKEITGKLRILILAGKGHNAGDAIIACNTILEKYPDSIVDLVLIYGDQTLKPLVKKALNQLLNIFHKNITQHSWRNTSNLLKSISIQHYDICLDGIFGMQFKPPIKKNLAELLDIINNNKNILIKVSVDLPSGCSDVPNDSCFIADFSYATGIVKSPLFNEKNNKYVGRIRYLDIGFFKVNIIEQKCKRVLLDSILNPLKHLRDPLTDKRSFGHLFIIGGSKNMSGAIMMSAMAAVKSGVGLTTVFAPETATNKMAAALPEVMWTGCSLNSEGGLSMQTFEKIIEKTDRATAILIGPGMDKSNETNSLIHKIITEINLPTIIDADALQPNIIAAVKKRKADFCQVVITPHIGEYNRISNSKSETVTDNDFKIFCKKQKLMSVLKGPITKISDGKTIMISPFGGPILARGGSGDILAGLIGSLIARPNAEIYKSLCRAVVWHGLAAEATARHFGQTAVQTTDILNFLGSVLRK